MIQEKIERITSEINLNPNMDLDSTNCKKYKLLDDFVMNMEIDWLVEEGWECNANHRELLSLSSFCLSWESNLQNVDTVLTGGFKFNGISDALTMPSVFWKGAFSIPDAHTPPPELMHFEKLGWFEHQPWEDGRRGCFIKTPGRVSTTKRFLYSSDVTKVCLLILV